MPCRYYLACVLRLLAAEVLVDVFGVYLGHETKVVLALGLILRHHLHRLAFQVSLWGCFIILSHVGIKLTRVNDWLRDGVGSSEVSRSIFDRQDDICLKLCIEIEIVFVSYTLASLFLSLRPETLWFKVVLPLFLLFASILRNQTLSIFHINHVVYLFNLLTCFFILFPDLERWLIEAEVCDSWLDFIAFLVFFLI